MRAAGRLPLGFGRKLGAGLGLLCWGACARSKRITRKNIELCFPELSPVERSRLARESMLETGKQAIEICQIWQRDKKWLDDKITGVSGESVFQQAIANNKGVIVLAPHLGNWEILGTWLLGCERRCTYLYQPPKQPFLEPLMKASRERFGAEIVPTNRRGIAELLKRIKSGEITGILPDQVPDMGSGAFSPFFTIPAYTMTLIHGLIQRTGCTVVFGVAIRERGGFHIRITQPPKGIYSANEQDSLRALNEGIESCVRHTPAQYQWEYKRFKAGVNGHSPY